MMLLENSATRDGDPLCLASASPRRHALLEGAGVPHVIAPVNVDESPRRGESADHYVRRMAETKLSAALAAPGVSSHQLVLTSDTVVVQGDRVLGKPVDEEDARAMLEGLSGGAHAVLTSWALGRGGGQLRLEVERSEVYFSRLNDQTIEAYLRTGEPMDKAGSYGIQGAGGALVSGYQGSFSNIVGLPLGPVLRTLVEFGAIEHRGHPVELRLRTIRGRIAAACQAVGRAPDEVSVVGASKGHDVETIQAALESGLTTFGENYVQEWTKKRVALPGHIRWHFIGRLQRNKAKLLVPHMAMIHGIDSLKTLRTVARLGQEHERSVPVCLQVNLGAEETKSGVDAEALGALIELGHPLEGIELCGLMAIPPKGTLGDTRGWFARLRALRDHYAHEDCPLPVLSMGMSSDFDGAVAEGATHVRIGSALFGPRP